MRACILLQALALLLLVSLPAQAEEPGGPLRFRAAVGGFLGSSYSVELRDGALFYGKNLHREQTGAEEIRPTREQWEAFRRSLDEINVWSWQSNYHNFNVLDGTQWALDVAYQDKSVKSTGSNSYPDAAGRPNNDPRPTAEFVRFQEAVRALLGGREFR